MPVPTAPWWEPDPTALGSPFFVMERVDGIVASDNPPYVFGGWVVDLGPEGRKQLEDGVVQVLAGLHAIDVTAADVGFLERPEYGETPLDQHLGYQRWYYDWARGDRRFTQIDRALDWLEANRPEDEGPTVLNWGDARLGNTMFRDGVPVAVLDWEMAALGAPEVDLAWAVHLHDFFKDLAVRFEMDPLEDFFPRDRVIATYEALTGRPVQNYDYYEVFAAVRYSIVSIRTGESSVATGTVPEPDHHDGLIMNGPLLEAMLDRLGAPTMDIGIFSSPRTVDGLVAAARSAADDGFGSYWTSQIFSVDALTGIAVAAKEVEGFASAPGWCRSSPATR